MSAPSIQNLLDADPELSQNLINLRAEKKRREENRNAKRNTYKTSGKPINKQYYGLAEGEVTRADNKIGMRLAEAKARWIATRKSAPALSAPSSRVSESVPFPASVPASEVPEINNITESKLPNSITDLQRLLFEHTQAYQMFPEGHPFRLKYGPVIKKLADKIKAIESGRSAPAAVAPRIPNDITDLQKLILELGQVYNMLPKGERLRESYATTIKTIAPKIQSIESGALSPDVLVPDLQNLLLALGESYKSLPKGSPLKVTYSSAAKNLADKIKLIEGGMSTKGGKRRKSRRRTNRRRDRR